MYVPNAPATMKDWMASAGTPAVSRRISSPARIAAFASWISLICFRLSSISRW